MSEFFFVVKMLAFTVVVVMLMQIRVGSRTIEQRSLSWLHESKAVEALRGVASGAVALGLEGVDWANRAIDRKLGSSGSSDARKSERRDQSRKTWEDEINGTVGDEVD